MIISFWILTADLRDLRHRLRNRGWIDDGDNPREGVQMARLAPAAGDTLHRIYVRVYGKLAEGEKDDDDVSLPVALRTRLGRMVRQNGTWDEERKGWALADKFWLIREDQREPDHVWQ